jgi:DNA-binding transcriptional LysR family regulator
MLRAQRRSRQLCRGRPALEPDPAAVGKSVAKLEVRLGVRLFQRSTRSLTLTEAGKLFLSQVSGSLTTIQNAVANLSSVEGLPAGTLKVSMGTVFGRLYIVPLLQEFVGFRRSTRTGILITVRST